MAEEKEILTILSKEEYEKVLAKLIKKFGEPKIVNRLSLQCTDYRWADIDTRIRITNGEAEIMQKVGDWKKVDRVEISVPIESNANIIFDLYKIFRNMMRDSEVLTPVIQLENRLFRTNDFEIKMTHQFGKVDVYNCEVEVLDNKLEPEDIIKKFGIPIHLPEHTQDFWKKWNERVNLDANKLSDKELMGIIEKYL